MFTNLLGVIIVSIIVFAIIMIINKKWEEQAAKRHPLLRKLIWIGVYIGIVCISGAILLGDFSKPSTVDITPLSKLGGLNISDIDSVFETIQASIYEIGGRSFRETNFRVAKRSCSYDYYDKTYPASVNISVLFFEDSEQAEIEFNRHRLGYSSRQKYEYVEVSENIEAFLSNSKVLRSDAYGFYGIFGRSVGTYIRIQNMIVTFGESGRNDNTIGELSSIAIEKFCEVLLSR